MAKTATIAARLRLAMDMSHMSAAELSKRTGISSGGISQYLSGKFEPKQDKIWLLSQALSVSPGWLMGFSDQEDSADTRSAIQIIYDSLSPKRKEQAMEYLRFLKDQNDREEQAQHQA